MNSDITEQYLDKLYDDLSKESSRILNDIKTDRNDTKKEVYQHQQFNIINSLMINSLKLRNLKKKIQSKIDN
jgi:hypothetical protein